MYSGIVTVAPGAEIPLNWHPIGELQFFLVGEGLLLDGDRNETPIATGGSVFSPSGPRGTHGFRNTGLGALADPVRLPIGRWRPSRPPQGGP
jgi:Cupin domain